MNFIRHSELAGLHALLSPSSYSWINYDDDKMVDSHRNRIAAALGTRKHEFASEAIQLGVKLPSSRKTMNLYVNDCIGFRMKTEQPLFYSPNIFGTADAIRFARDPKTKLDKLMIFDLKTGVSKASFNQLMIYAALFCLEYDVRPVDIQIELRIYQNDEIYIMHMGEDFDMIEIINIMDKIVRFDRIIRELNEEALD